tara:strand:+ start:1145 stop:1933 length:789 start_codon:yes stop_codon:yes gene_type:complete
VIKAKKSLGQNFLIDEYILNKIINVTKIQDQTVLEIGPGTGNLTSFILKKNPKKLFVIEKDETLVSALNERFGNKITIINKDILKFNEKNLTKKKITVFGNLPYNISTEILCKWIINLDKDYFWFDSLVFMFQKEVADRIISESNTSHYGRLSILAKWKLEIEKIIDIKPDSFSPRPKIDSTLLFFQPKKNYLDFKNSKNLEKITRIFFNHRRKMIRKPYNQIFNNNQDIIKKLSLNLDSRPQNLDFETYYNLTKEYEILKS